MNPAMKPLRYNRRQVALMVTVALHFNPSLQIAIPARGEFPASTINLFNLTKSGSIYQWQPR